MKTVFCNLRVDNWSINEKFELQNSPILKSTEPKEIYLFGKVQDSDENVMDGFSFQLKIGGVANQEHESFLGEEHIYVGINLPLNELEMVQKQLSLGTVKLSFNVGLLFKQNISLFELPRNKKCTLHYFCKTVSSSNK